MPQDGDTNWVIITMSERTLRELRTSRRMLLLNMNNSSEKMVIEQSPSILIFRMPGFKYLIFDRQTNDARIS